MKANGKADLYFHAYFWEQYLRSLNYKNGKSSMMSPRGKKALKGTKTDDEDNDASGAGDLGALSDAKSGVIDIFSADYPFMKRVIGLSATLSKVIVNIKKFPFHEKMYHKYANEFGQRNTQKKMKYLEEI